MTVNRMTFDCASLLKDSVGIHGHIRPGQVLGARMAMSGLEHEGTMDKYQGQLEAYKAMPDEGLFLISNISVSIVPEDMPDRPHGRYYEIENNTDG